MDNFVSSALKDIWCTPAQDEQYIFKMKRLTGYLGFSSRIEVMTTSISPPTTTSRWHLFALSVAYPDLLSMVSHPNHWVKLSDCANQTLRIIDIYNDLGVKIGLSTAYFTFTTERMLLLAIQEIPGMGVLTTSQGSKKLLDYNTDNFYIRIYKNAYFNSPRWVNRVPNTPIPNPVYVMGVLYTQTSDVLALQNAVLQNAGLPGVNYLYKNGFVVDTITLGNVALGDYLEWVYDASVISKQDLGYLIDLKTYVSDLDSKSKYIIHQTTRSSTIDYQDDVTLLLMNNSVGIQVPRNARWTLRNLTHQDYGLREDVIGSILQAIGSSWSIDNTKLYILPRYSGYDRVLVDEHHRIKELYKLPDAKILSAMQGVDSTVSEWRAQALEASNYAMVMSSSYDAITKSMVIDALGYNSIANDVAKSIIKVQPGFNYVSIPSAYTLKGSAYLYDSNGYLINYLNYTNLPSLSVGPDVSYVEFIRESQVDRFDESLNVHTVYLSNDRDYRYYLRDNSTNPQVNTWQEIPVTDPRISIVDGVMSWVNVPNTFDTLVKSNSGVITQQYSLPMTDGLLVINMTSKVLVDGVLIDRELLVPPGELDVWLNGRTLVRNVDYRVKFPSIVICAKSYLSGIGDQQVTVRMKGLCTSDMLLQDENEYGFIVDGILSIDNEFDIRDDKVTSISIAGGLKVPSELTFQETGGVVYVTDSELNGKPYAVKDCVIRLTDLTGVDSLDLRTKSVAVDKKVSAYLTQYADKPAVAPTGSKLGNHVLYSPLIAKVAMALKSGAIDNSILSQQYSDNQVLDLIDPYLYLYEYDPTHPKNRISAGLVDIHPTHLTTTLTLSIWQYSFLTRVVKLLAKDLVTLSGHIQVI